jgi:hypothetical protein
MNAAAMNPYVDAGLAAADIGFNIIGAIMQKQAYDEARADTKALDYRNFEYGKSRDKVSDRQFGESLKLSKRAMALNERRQGLDEMLSKYGVTQSNIMQVGDILNKNVALKNRALQTWGL